MLRFLRIRDFALIRQLAIEFGAGLNLLTGETGSGKSILVDALGLLLGARSSQEMVRSKCDSAVIEGLFELDSGGSVAPILIESGFEIEDESLLIRREIFSTGRSRVFINNILTTLSLLKTIGEKLADIHGQQDQKSLLDLTTHLDWLDYFGANMEAASEVQEHYKKLRALIQRLESMETDERERLRRVDILQFQLNEIQQAALQPHEKEELENENIILSNRERLLTLASEAYRMLYENESSILSQANRLEQVLKELESFDTSWAPQREVIRESFFRLEDLAYALRDYTTRLDFSPERLEQVQQRLHELEMLMKKYGFSIAEILQYAERSKRELEELISHAETTRNLSEQIIQEEKKYLEAAEKLSEKRRSDARSLETEIRKEFKALAMERMELQVRFHPREESKREGRLPSYYGPGGIDHVELLIAPNKGEEMKPLARIASGGELSRIMLSIKSLCGSEEAGKTLVFDEVDAGIGGRVAEAVGKRLRDIAKNNQVLCVTHLPQIAAFANHHFNVSKEEVGGRTETLVKSLKKSERIQELARMLGGEIISETTQRHAREMLKHSTVSGSAHRK